VKEDYVGLVTDCEWTPAHSAASTKLGGSRLQGGPGRPRTNWRGVVKKDLRRIGLTWKEAEVAILDRLEWRQYVAQYITWTYVG